MENKLTRMSPHSQRPVTMSASRPAEPKPRACRRGRASRFLTGLFGLLAFAGVAASLTPAFAFTRDITITTVTTWIVGADIGPNPLPKVTGPLPMSATLTPTLPNGVTFDATARTVTGTPTAAFSKTRFTYTVTDADGDRIRYTFPIEVVADLTPAFAPGAAIVNQSWTAGTAIGTLLLPAASGGNAPLTYSLTPPLPTGLTFNATARTVTGTPTATFSKNSFTYTVTDANDDTAMLTFDIEVVADLTPAFASGVSIPAQSWAEGTAISTLQLPAATGGNAPLTYSLTTPLPTGVTFDATARTLAGTPTAALVKTQFTYTVTDGDGDTAALNFDIEVAAEPRPAFAQGVAITIPSWTAGTAISTLQLPAATGGNAPLTYSLTTPLPTGLTFNPTARTLTGTPTAAFSKTSFTYTVTDANGDTATLTFDIEVAADLTPAFASGAAISAQPWTAGTAISTLQLPAATGGNAPLTYSLTPALPTGLTFDATARTVTGTPTATLGKTQFTYTVTDGDGDTATLTFDIEVAASVAVDAPVVRYVTYHNSPASGDTYRQGERIEVMAVFDIAVVVTGAPRVELTIGSDKRYATYYNPPGSNDPPEKTLVFLYTVQAGDVDTDGIYIAANALSLNGGSISTNGTDAELDHNAVAADANRKVDGRTVSVPAVSSISFSNAPLDGDTYGFGEEIEVAIAFNVSVMVTGKPKVGLTIGNRTRQAVYDEDKSDESKLVFFYRVDAGDVDTDGISIAANKLALNSGEIWINAGGGIRIDAKLDHEAVVPSARRKVDGVVPVVFYTDPTGTWIANQAIADLDPTTKDTDIASYMVKSGSSLPPGLALDGTTGVISGRPTTVNPDTHDTVVVITDEAGNTGETTVTFPVILGDKPAFVQGTAIPAQSWTEGTDIGTLQLPVATGGDAPLTYSLSPAVPTGLTFDSTARTLSGTPTAVFDKATFTYTVSDADGDPATLTFDIEVISPAMAKRQRLRVVNEVVLPELARAMTASTAGAVADRLGSVAPDMGNTGSKTLASLAHLLEANDQALNEGDFSWRRALAGKSFSLGLSGDGGDGARPGSGGVAVWGAGDWRNLSLDGPVDWDGDMFAAHLGVDAALGEDVRAGVAVSRFESSIDYTDNGGDAPLKGTHENRMTSVHPYAGLSLPDGSRLWALAGYGRGEIEINDAAAGRQSSDSTLLTAAAGGAWRLVSEGATAFDLKSEVQGSRLEVDDNGDLIKGLSVRTWRMRLALEGSRDFELFPDTVLTPSLELGLRWDGGDGETGTGVEIGGGLGYVDREIGLTAAISGRALAAHTGGVRQWGASGSLRLDPGADGRGLSLSLTPSWGEVGSGMERLWEDGLTGREADANGDVPGARIEAELGYGLPAFGGAGLVTPYGGAVFGNGGGRRYRVGGRLNLSTGLDLSLEGSRRESRDGTPEHGANLAIRMIW